MKTSHASASSLRLWYRRRLRSRLGIPSLGNSQGGRSRLVPYTMCPCKQVPWPVHPALAHLAPCDAEASLHVSSRVELASLVRTVSDSLPAASWPLAHHRLYKLSWSRDQASRPRLRSRLWRAAAGPSSCESREHAPFRAQVTQDSGFIRVAAGLTSTLTQRTIAARPEPEVFAADEVALPRGSSSPDFKTWSFAHEGL